MDKYLLRRLYNGLKLRPLKIAAVRALEAFNLPVYRLAIDTNNACNLRCIMCYMSRKEFRQQFSVMPLEIFECLARDIFGMVRVLELSCGYEPFLTRNFMDYLRVARRYCHGVISVCTNATLLDDNTIGSIVTEGLLDELIISIDGLTEATYNRIRPNGNFNSVLAALSAIKTHRGKGGSPVVRINYTMLHSNIEDLSHMYDFARDYGVGVVQLRHARLARPFEELFEQSLFYHQELYDRTISSLRLKFDINPSDVVLLHPPLFSQRQSVPATKSQCAYPWFYFIIASNGDVKLCHSSVVGNINERSFSAILRSDRVRDIRRRLLRGEHGAVCGNCLTINDVSDVNQPETFIRPDKDFRPYT
ncbi:MAG: radical SAM protein [Nitrospirae bacterium]|uniref:radical SAM protein n=1 Tax=Candidatus Magnetobacterium casense TaxID=1455061 RepID=UPI00058C13D7|nr:radical SAM protein [Candidatus Magnetobacterium casensis]MBF0336500.1 radical SAM protein [Nitrospirota bacterium]